ncbi:suppressor of fused domain protein [Mycobacteroides chelonae]|uniref:Suppressor of fused protein (SUFU) n=1 Tax=Mycobacteroides chelonae TaxID=1774 RepID=A0A1S1M7G7_MYCCH|nr:suppressor of fused domain protein [Mycobacteroides chelonae]OHU77835.1 Suppressor of fused protein (SUFU) [Mycobacteroides chelonae]QQG86994.1 suppressor of fused domain protein [Mycobacteroides chelonae]QQG91810.1 suppressor of fused domain protein [Mycobacteroides chelonae]
MSSDEIVRQVRAHLADHFTGIGAGEPDSASVTFLGAEPYELLRYGPDNAGVSHFVSVGASRYPMADPGEMLTSEELGPRAEVLISLRGNVFPGLARSLAVLAASPAVEGLVLTEDALVDLGQPLWDDPARQAYTAVLLQTGDIPDLLLPEPLSPVRFLVAVPITANEAAWVRLKGADALRDAWLQADIDVKDPSRAHAQPS